MKAYKLHCDGKQVSLAFALHIVQIVRGNARLDGNASLANMHLSENKTKSGNNIRFLLETGSQLQCHVFNFASALSVKRSCTIFCSFTPKTAPEATSDDV